MKSTSSTPAAGQAAHLFTLREVPALDGSGATAHELETPGHTVAHVYPDTGEETAAFIVRACNAHAGLVKALELIARSEGFAGGTWAGELQGIARAALQSAKE